jgi:AcrR family transcriptional regulator
MNTNSKVNKEQMKQVPERKKRLSRDDWLAHSMEILSKEGGAKLNIDNLCRAVGVTKGSFYTHFKSRADFVSKFLAFWDDTYTQAVIERMENMSNAAAEDRLFAVMKLLSHEKFTTYDIAVRAWAAQDPVIGQGVKKVDQRRYSYIRQIFEEIGFSGDELDLRTRIFVVYYSLEVGIRLPLPDMSSEERLKREYRFFIRR